MVNQYAGSTIKVSGATYLDTRAILHVQEGFRGVNSDGTGNSTEYVDVGDFEVSDFNHGGAFRQSLQLNAHALSKRTNYMNSYFTKGFKSAYSYFTDFDDEETFNQKWSSLPNTASAYGITNGTYRGLSCGLIGGILMESELDNFRIITKFKSSASASTNLNGLVFHCSDENLNRNYLFESFYGGFGLFRINESGTTLLGGVSYGFADNTYYWLMVEQFQKTMKAYYSTNGLSYILGASFYISDDAQNMSGGFVGFRGIGTGSQTITFDFFDTQEFGTIYTKEDIIKGGYAMAGVNGVTVAAEIAGITYLIAGSPSSGTVFGTSNNVFLKGGTLLGRWYPIHTSGMTFNNFVVEVEARGSCYNAFGLLIGNGPGVDTRGEDWYGHYMRTDTNNSSSDTNVVQQILDDEDAAHCSYPWRDRGHFWQIKNDYWYRLKLIRQGTKLTWEINDQVVNSIYGTSLILGLTGVYIGVFTKLVFPGESWLNGLTCEFRNFRISELDDIVDEVVLEPGSQAQSLIDRVMPDGYAINNKSGNVEIFKIGDSRGVHDIATTDYLDSDTQDLSNIVGKKYVINKSGDNINIAYSSNSRVQRQADSNNIDIVVDDLNPSQKVALSSLTFTNKDVQSVQVGIANRPTLEQYDTINVVDTNLGISKQFIAFNIDKSFSAQDGKFRETLQLNPIEP